MHNLSKITLAGLALGIAVLLGCTPARYRRAADKEVYNIIQEKQSTALKQTNNFTIDTPYSQRKPDDIKAQEIIDDRTRDAIRAFARQYLLQPVVLLEQVVRSFAP